MRIRLCLLFLVLCPSLLAVDAVDPLMIPSLNPVKALEAPKHAPLVLVKDGEPRFVIVRDRAAERRRFPYGWQRGYRSAENAAEAIATNVFLATGRVVPILDADEKVPSGKLALLVGRSATTDKMGLDISKFPSEGFEIRSFAGGIAIVGDDTSLADVYDAKSPHGKHRGTLWAAYDFLERFFGLRVYNPGPDGAIRPQVKDLTMRPFAYRDAPAFANRGCYYLRCPRETTSKALGVEVSDVEIESYQNAMRLARTIAFTSMHSPHALPWVAHDPSRKEKAFFRSPYGHWYFDERDDMRCYFDVFGNDFADMLVDSYKEFFSSEKPDGKSLPYLNRDYVVFGQCDGGVGLADAMHDERVKRLGLITDANVKLGHRGYLSDVYGRFYCYVAERLKRELPDKKLIIMPYSQYVYPPTQKKYFLPDNVEAGVCLGDMPKFFPNERRREAAKRILAGWREALGGRPAREIWTYSANNSAFIQDVAGEYIGEMINYFGEDLGRYQVFHELGLLLTELPDDRFTAMSFPHTTYLAMRFYWNPAFDAKAALNEFWPLYYGAAGKPLKQAHRVIKEAYLRLAVPKCEYDPVYPAKVVDRIEALLDEAKAAVAEGSPEARRYETYASILRFEIGRQRRRAKSRPPFEDPRLPEDALDFEDHAEIAGEMGVQFRHYNGWGREYLAYNRSALLMGDRNCYGINYLVNRPNGKDPAKTFINLVEPRIRAGWGREPQNFFGLEVNGKALASTMPGKDAFKTSVTENEATAEMIADYDGCVMSVTATVRKGSPLLFLKVRHAAGRKVESCRLSLHCVPSELNANVGRKDQPHARELITAERTVKGPSAHGERMAPVELVDQDRYVILQDAVLDGTGYEKGFGPSLLTLPPKLSSLVSSAKVQLTTSYGVSTVFELKPTCKEFEVGLLQVNERVPNADFQGRFSALIK